MTEVAHPRLGADLFEGVAVRPASSTAHTVEGTYPTDKLPTKFACEIQGYDPTTYLERKAASRMSRFAQMAVIASNMALEDAALDVSKEESFRVGVDLGTGIGGVIEMTTGGRAAAQATP